MEPPGDALRETAFKEAAENTQHSPECKRRPAAEQRSSATRPLVTLYIF
jgi:hypothetical protein